MTENDVTMNMKIKVGPTSFYQLCNLNKLNFQFYNCKVTEFKVCKMTLKMTSQ